MAQAQQEMFLFEMRPQRVWGAEVAADLFLSGTGAALFFLAAVLQGVGFVSEGAGMLGEWVGLGAVVLGASFLLAHLGVPTRFLGAFRRPHSSWISRGTLSITLFCIFALLVALATTPGLEALPWGQGTAAGTVLLVLALLAATAVMAYTGLVLASWPAIAFWNTPLLPLMFMAWSFLGAAGALLGLAALNGGAGLPLRLLSLSLVLGVGLTLLLYVQGMSSGTVAAREGVRRLLDGEGRMWFGAGVVALGLVVPAVLLGLDVGGAVGGAAAAIQVATAILLLVGGYCLRQSILKAGVYGYPI